uniref:amidohydrolase family protein n=1 Tax=Parolsenella massiliensis TaxID=1871022 RepID=UPI000ADC3178|nr:amidohydrolase family protein [Parolsenella massiliensis]
MINIIDTHVHVWDLDNYRLPWLDGEGPTLRRTWSVSDYAACLDESHGYRVEQAVYIEVDMAHDERERENELACKMVSDPECAYGAACISGNLDEPGFDEYITKWAARPEIRGLRQVLHVPSAAPGTCLEPGFLDNVRRLGELGLVFEGCVRCPELGDLVTVARECPDTTIVLNHMGIVDADIMGAENPTADERAYQDAWKRNMAEIGKLPNVVCKVSGLNPMKPWSTESLSRAVGVALDAFDADKVMFASNFPVLHVAMTLDEWICQMLKMTESLDAADREALFAENARRVYGLR